MKELSCYLRKLAEELFLYQEAGEEAVPEVRKAIERFRNLPIDKRKKMPLLFWLLGSSTQDYKFTQKESQYVEESLVPEQVCENCLYGYIELATLGTEDERIICSQIQGYIKKPGWCNRWKAVDTPEETIYQSEQMRRTRFSFFGQGKTQEEQLARAVMRIIKDKSEAQGIDPKQVIDHLIRMKGKYGNRV